MVSETLGRLVDTFQVSVMEEKIKLSNLKNVDSTGSLHQKYQELLKAMQSKDELISQLEAQLEKQVGTDVRQSLFSLSVSVSVGLGVSNPCA